MISGLRSEFQNANPPRSLVLLIGFTLGPSPDSSVKEEIRSNYVSADVLGTRRRARGGTREIKSLR